MNEVPTTMQQGLQNRVKKWYRRQEGVRNYFIQGGTDLNCIPFYLKPLLKIPAITDVRIPDTFSSGSPLTR